MVPLKYVLTLRKALKQRSLVALVAAITSINFTSVTALDINFLSKDVQDVRYVRTASKVISLEGSICRFLVGD